MKGASSGPGSTPTGAVFLSYASQDAAAASRICDALRLAGIEVWLDQSELRGGDAWDASIRKQIKACSLFIPVISANTKARVEGYFRLEWKLAVDRSDLMAAERAFIVPVVIDETTDGDALVPDKFRQVQWTRLPGGGVTAEFVERITLLLSREDYASPPRASVVNPAAAPVRVSHRKMVFPIVGLMALLALGAIVTLKMAAHKAEIGMVAVLPFENATGDPSIEYLSDGISENLINKLSSLNGLRVISRTSAFAFKGRKLEPKQIGRELGVDALILGSLTERGQTLDIAAELVSVRDATHLWGERYARRVEDLMQVEGEIAETIARTLRRQLNSAEKASLTDTATSDPEAYRLYLKGRSFLVGNQQEMDKSVDYLQQAIARAPDYAMAYAGLAEAYTRQAFLRAESREQAVGKARAAVDRALELDPKLAEAHTALGLVRFYFEWDWSGADAEFRRSLELNPGSEEVHEEYGNFLMAMGRLDEGLAQSREAARLDPLSVGPVHDMAINALIRQNYEQAARGFRRAIDIDPNWTWGYIKLARTLALQKKCQDAFVQTENGERRIAGGAAPLSRSWLGVTYALCGDRARARQKLDELRGLEKQQYVDPATLAAIHEALGEADEALREYEKAFQDRSPSLVYARVARQITQLGNDPRFTAIVERMKFPPPST